MRITGSLGARAMLCAVASASLINGAAKAQSGVVRVRASDVIYAAGTQYAEAAVAGGTVPQAIIDIPAGAKAFDVIKIVGSIPCFSSEGCVDLASSGSGTFYYNDPDGDGAWPQSNCGGYGSISGIAAPGEGFLVGVFIATGGPSGPAPEAKSYSAAIEAKPAAYPRLNQVFFIGDGLTGRGNGTGSRQIAYVPPHASKLVLGISDCDNFSAPTPGYYGDNTGTYTVEYGILMGANARIAR
jgi:hypothetical protein